MTAAVIAFPAHRITRTTHRGAPCAVISLAPHMKRKSPASMSPMGILSELRTLDLLPQTDCRVLARSEELTKELECRYPQLEGEMAIWAAGGYPGISWLEVFTLALTDYVLQEQGPEEFSDLYGENDRGYPASTLRAYADFDYDGDFDPAA